MAGIFLNPGRCCGCTSSDLSCSPCPLPKRDLTLTWTNLLVGNGSTTLTYDGASTWNSGCSSGLLYSLACHGGLIQFSVTYFISGVCPTGQSQSCVSPGSNPLAITLASYTCSPFALHYTISSAGCPVLWSDGYTAFDIS